MVMVVVALASPMRRIGLTMRGTVRSQARGDAVLSFLQNEGKGQGAGALSLSWCDLTAQLSGHNFCLSRRATLRASQGKKVCQEQLEAFSLLYHSPFFGACNAATGMYDFSILYTLPREILETTLIVVNFREPAQRVASVRTVMENLDHRRVRRWGGVCGGVRKGCGRGGVGRGVGGAGCGRVGVRGGVWGGVGKGWGGVGRM